MKSLFLLSNEEKRKFPKELIIKDVYVESDPQYLSNILNNNYQVIYMTKDFTNACDYNLIDSFVQFIHVCTQIKFSYLIDADTQTDNVLRLLYKYGNGNIFKSNIANLNLQLLEKIEQINERIEPIEIQQSPELYKKDLADIKQNLVELSGGASEAYLKRNKPQLIDALQILISKLDENEELLYQYNHAQNSIRSLEINRDNLNTNIRNLQNTNQQLKQDIQTLRRSILEQQYKINTYNQQRLNNPQAEDFIINLDQHQPYNPITIYFKEIEDINFLNLYEALLHNFTGIRKLYTKSIILEKQNRIFLDPYTKLGYTIFNENSRLDTLINNDKLIRYGNAYGLLELLSRPEMRLQVLLILDRTGNDTINVDSDKLIPFYLGRKRYDIKSLSIDDNSFISPYEGKWQSLDPLLRYNVDNSNWVAYMNNCILHPLTDYINNLTSMHL